MVNKDSHYGTPYSYNCLKLLSQNGALVTWEIHQVLAVLIIIGYDGQALVTWEIHQVLAVLIIIGYDGMAKYYERTTVTVSGLINV